MLSWAFRENCGHLVLNEGRKAKASERFGEPLLNLLRLHLYIITRCRRRVRCLRTFCLWFGFRFFVSFLFWLKSVQIRFQILPLNDLEISQSAKFGQSGLCSVGDAACFERVIFWCCVLLETRRR